MTNAPSPNRRDVLVATTALAGLAATSVGRAAAQSQTRPDLSGKSVLITGSSSGFGRLSSIYLAEAGATVIASMRNLDGGNRPEAKALKAEAEEKDLDLHIVQIDVTDEGQVAEGVMQAEEIAGGALDVVLSNAGIGISGPVELHDPDQALKQIDTNTLGGLRMARAALPKMRERGQGLIMPVSSQLGRLVLPNIGMYCTSKFALEAMFEAMAYELAPTGVEITLIQPGGYPTEIWENGSRYLNQLLAQADDAREEAYAAHLQMSRGFSSNPRTTDPMDVPRAVAEIIAMAPGDRPLRRPVHPDTRATDALNSAHAQVQASLMSSGPYKAWHDAVTS